MRFVVASILLVVLAVPVGAGWTPVGPGWSLRPVTLIAADPAGSGVVYTRIQTNGPGFSEWSSVFRSDDHGDSWLPVTGALLETVVTAIAVWPGDASRVLAGTATGLYYTDDGGSTWFATEHTNSIQAIAIAPDGTFALAALEAQGALITRDQGRSWTAVGGLADTEVDHIAIALSGHTIAATNDAQALLSTDSAETWTTAATDLPGPIAQLVALSGDASPVVAVVNRLLYEFDPTAHAWALSASLPASTSLTGVAYDPSRRLLFAYFPWGLFRSEDDGLTWSQIRTFSTSDPPARIEAVPGDALLAIWPLRDARNIRRASLRRSTNGGLTWTEPTRAPQALNIGGLETGPTGTVYAGGGIFDNRVHAFRSRDHGNSWVQINSIEQSEVRDLQRLAPDPTRPSVLFSGHVLGVLRSTDDGGSWTNITSGLPETNRYWVTAPPSTPGRIFVGVREGVFFSDDDGNTWTQVLPQAPADRQVVGFESLPGTLFHHVLEAFTVETFLERSDDRGRTWRDITPTVPGQVEDFRNLYALEMDPNDSDVLLAAVTARSNGGIATVVRSEDGGDSWTLAGEGLPASRKYDLAVIEGEPTTFLVTTEDGIFQSTSQGRTWHNVSGGVTPRFVLSVAASTTEPGVAFAGTFGGGIFRLDTNPTCTPTPTALCLEQGRFHATATYTTRTGISGTARAQQLTGNTGYFWFFTPTNVEVLAKVLNACNRDQPAYWAFATGLTNLEVQLTITDNKNGATNTYTNPLSTPFQPLQDTSAFLTCP